MRQTVFIALNDLRVYFADRGNFVYLFALPIALTLMLGFLIQGGGSEAATIRIDLHDLDQSAASQQFINQLWRVNETLLLCPADDEDDSCALGDSETFTVDQSIERVRNSDTRALIVIPQGYGDRIQSAQPVTIDYYARSDSSGGFNDPVLASLQTVIQRVNAALQASTVGTNIAANFTVAGQSVTVFNNDSEQVAFAEALRTEAETLLSQQPDTVNFVLSSGGEEIVAGTGFGQAVPGQGATFVMFTVLGGMVIMMRERREWTLQRLMVLPLSRAQILGGKILVFVVLGMVQFVIVFVVGVFTGTNFGNAPVAILLLMFTFVLAITALAFAIAARLKNEEQAGSMSLLLSLTFAPLGGAWWPLVITPRFMQIIGHFTPTAWVMDGFHDIIFYGGGLVDVLPEMGVLLVIAAVCFAIGIAGFQYE